MMDSQIQQYAMQQIRMGLPSTYQSQYGGSTLGHQKPLPVDPNMTDTLLGLNDSRGQIGQFSRGNPIYNAAGPAPNPGGLNKNMGFPTSVSDLLQGAIQRRLARARDMSKGPANQSVLQGSFGSY
jgi:hypothetical protein